MNKLETEQSVIEALIANGFIVDVDSDDGLVSYTKEGFYGDFVGRENFVELGSKMAIEWANNSIEIEKQKHADYLESLKPGYDEFA